MVSSAALNSSLMYRIFFVSICFLSRRMFPLPVLVGPLQCDPAKLAAAEFINQKLVSSK